MRERESQSRQSQNDSEGGRERKSLEGRSMIVSEREGGREREDERDNKRGKDRRKEKK